MPDHSASRIKKTLLGKITKKPRCYKNTKNKPDVQIPKNNPEV